MRLMACIGADTRERTMPLPAFNSQGDVEIGPQALGALTWSWGGLALFEQLDEVKHFLLALG